MRALPALLLAFLLALLPGGAALAQEDDFLAVDGKLSGEDFYRLVSCRALPGGPCTVDPVRWGPRDARDLRVALAPAPPGYPPDLARRVGLALDAAIAEINGAGADLRLRRAAKGEEAQVVVHLSPVREGEAIRGTGIRGVDGQIIGAALVTVWWDEGGDLSDGVIVMAADLPPPDVGPVMLEELTQAMGLMTDIRAPAYDELSVFAEDSNRVGRLGPQDGESLRRHYPGGAP